LSEVKFYFDESVELAVSTQLAAAGIDVVSAQSLGILGDSDQSHLKRATEMKRTLCTYDADFLELATQNSDHAGIIFAPQQKVSIGAWVKELKSLHARLSMEAITGQVIYLSNR